MGQNPVDNGEMPKGGSDGGRSGRSGRQVGRVIQERVNLASGRGQPCNR